MSFQLVIYSIIGVLSFFGAIYLDYMRKIKNERDLRNFQKNKFDNDISVLEKELENIQEVLSKKEKLFQDINNVNDSSVKKISSLFSDYLLLQYDLSANLLSKKKRPAFSEAKRIKDLKTETRNYIEQYKIMLYKYEYLLNVFPELENYIEDFQSIKEIDDYSKIDNLSNEFDYVRKYLSKEEYKSLSEVNRNQLALNNYIKGKKSNWQIGRDYELFCGQSYEGDGWNVQYFGMEKKLNDLGRDLIAIKGNETHIIQCKYWSKEKLIHEKHILQLFATTYIMRLSSGDLFNHYVPVLMTNINLSTTALDFAKKLDVKIVKLNLSEFPRIKCNVNGGNKIYHLPFDQKYDITKIKTKDEFYAFTIEEAVRKGFRRACKYYG